jgi:hypothetical protein
MESYSPHLITTSPEWVRYIDKLQRLRSSGVFSDITTQTILRTANDKRISRLYEDSEVLRLSIERLRYDSLQFVSDFARETERGIRLSLSRFFDKSTTGGAADIEAAAARIARIKGFTINSRQAESFKRIIAEMASRRYPGTADMTARQIQLLINRTYKTMLMQRARMIARTEISEAVNLSKRAVWSDASLSGRLNGNLYEIVWRRFGDSCPRCIAMDGRTAEVSGGNFLSSTVIGGGRYNGTQITMYSPPVHPN